MTRPASAAPTAMGTILEPLTSASQRDAGERGRGGGGRKQRRGKERGEGEREKEGKRKGIIIMKIEIGQSVMHCFLTTSKYICIFKFKSLSTETLKTNFH